MWHDINELTSSLQYTRDAPIIGRYYNRYQPIIGRFADNRPIVVYTIGKYKFLLHGYPCFNLVW